MVCLSCTATGERVCLAAEGFGNRHCFLENIADKNVPPDLSQCVFVIEQALSVRALQELVTAAGSETVSILMLFYNRVYYKIQSLYVCRCRNMIYRYCKTVIVNVYNHLNNVISPDYHKKHVCGIYQSRLFYHLYFCPLKHQYFWQFLSVPIYSVY